MNFGCEADALFNKYNEDAHVNLGIRKALKTNSSKNRSGVLMYIKQADILVAKSKCGLSIQSRVTCS